MRLQPWVLQYIADNGCCIVSEDTLDRRTLIIKALVLLDPASAAVNEFCEEVWAELCEVLDDLAPDGCYFGGHPDDPACVGYWLDDKSPV